MKLKAIYFLFLCFICSSVSMAKDLKGWAGGLGTEVWCWPTLTYSTTSIGDIKIPCSVYSGIGSLTRFMKGGLWELGIDTWWVYEYGSKNIEVEGYPAKAESKMWGGILCWSALLNYWRDGKIWFGSGVYLGSGLCKESFRINLYRNNYTIPVFTPSTNSGLNLQAGIIILSAQIVNDRRTNNLKTSCDVQLGCSVIDAMGSGGYIDLGSDGYELSHTYFGHWYIQIRELFPINLREY